MAVCSAQYKFLLVDFGDSRQQSDDSVYFNSKLWFPIEENHLNIPQKERLPNSERILSFFVVDDTFRLSLAVLEFFGNQLSLKSKK